MTHALELAEQTIYPILDWLRLVFEIGAAAWIAIGFVIVVGALLREGYTGKRYAAIRLALSRCLSLALEFQLAADILATTIAPSLAASVGDHRDHPHRIELLPVEGDEGVRTSGRRATAR